MGDAGAGVRSAADGVASRPWGGVRGGALRSPVRLPSVAGDPQ
ncbi:hypothetical protein [Streptomyces kronopolitis]